MRISVNVKPGSAKNEVLPQEAELTVRLRAKPENGKANSALICVLADHFGVSKSNVKILTGKTARRKIVDIQGIGGPEGT